MSSNIPKLAPPPLDCKVVELRQYALHPGQREILIELFDREFIETQEAVGMAVMGQFRDLDDPDRFVWLRGFADMATRNTGLESFYDGPVWGAHRTVANATMIDSSNVLLLRPAWNGSPISSTAADRAGPGSTSSQKGALAATIFYLRDGAASEVMSLANGLMSDVLRAGGGSVLGWYVTEPAENTFPKQPVREAENVLVGFAMFKDEDALEDFVKSGIWTKEVAPDLDKLLTKVESHRLTPTARSAIHA